MSSLESELSKQENNLKDINKRKEESLDSTFTSDFVPKRFVKVASLISNESKTIEEYWRMARIQAYKNNRETEADLVLETSILERRADNAEPQVFDPTIVPNGFLCSDDPVLRFRAAAYAESAKRRHHFLGN